MYKFYDGNREVEIPTTLEELTPSQYLYFLMISSVYATMRVLPVKEFKVRWLSFLSGLENVDYTLLIKERREKYEEAVPMLDGFFTVHPKTGELRPKFDTASNLLPQHEGYNGPGDWLEGMTYGEFVECQTVLTGIDPEDEEQTKEAYGHIARVMYHIPTEEDIPEILYFHAPTLFRNVLKNIETAPININGQAIDFRIIFQSNKTGKNLDDKTGWTGITFEVASSGVFGGVKEVENTDFWMVLLYLYRCKFEYLHSKNKG